MPARGGGDRAAAVLGPDPGVGGAAVDVGDDPVVRRRGDDDLADRRRRGRRRNRSCCVRRAGRTPWLRAAPISSQTVNSSSNPTSGGSGEARTRRASSSITATAALLSAPRIAVVGVLPAAVDEYRARPARSTARCPGARTAGCSRGPARACARTGCRRPSRPAGPASSSSTSSPIPSSSAATQSAHGRSCPDGLSIRQSAANVSPSRWRSASVARLTWPGSRETSGSPVSAGASVERASAASTNCVEQRRRPLGARLELRVVLRRDEERVDVPRQLDRLDQPLVWRRARAHEPGRLEPPAQVVVDLIAMTVALVHDRLAVELADPGPVVQLDRVGAQPHRAAHVGDLLLLGEQVDHRERRLGIELGRVGAVHPGDVARELGDRDLHPETDPEIRDPALAGDLGRPDLALDPAAAEAAGDQDPSRLLEPRRDGGITDRLGVDPVDLDRAAVVDAGVLERLDHGQVGVLELHVLADERDPDRLGRLGGLAGDRLPVEQVRRRGLEPEVLAQDVVVDALGPEHERDLVDVGNVARGDDGLDRQAREQRDLLPDLGATAPTPSGRRPCRARFRSAAAR